MDCRVTLTNHDIDNIISVLYRQIYLDDETALALIDRLEDELGRCIAENTTWTHDTSERSIELRRQLTRQLYFQNRPRSPENG